MPAWTSKPALVAAWALLGVALAACESPVRPAGDPDAPQPGDSGPAGYLGFRKGRRAGLDLNAEPSLPLA